MNGQEETFQIGDIVEECYQISNITIYRDLLLIIGRFDDIPTTYGLLVIKNGTERNSRLCEGAGWKYRKVQ